jgi:hypothetical protein
MWNEPDSLRFASDATWAGIGGGILLLFAAITIWAERRRVKRDRIDAVGWMPWTKLFFAAMLVGVTLLMFAVKGWSGK